MQFFGRNAFEIIVYFIQISICQMQFPVNNDMPKHTAHTFDLLNWVINERNTIYHIYDMIYDGSNITVTLPRVSNGTFWILNIYI